MIDKNNKFIFTQIPKTGTTSIATDLKGRGIIDVEYSNQFKKHVRANIWFHALMPAVYKNIFKFTFVRNPLDRLVSEYCYLKKLATDPPYKQKNEPHTLAAKKFFNTYNYNFTDFIKYVTDNWDQPEAIFPVKYLKENTLCEFATLNFMGRNGSFIVDYVGRFETLQQDYDIICNKLNIPTRKLPHKNKSIRNKDWRSYYTDDTREAATCIWMEDIIRFDYGEEAGLSLTDSDQRGIPIWSYE